MLIGFDASRAFVREATGTENYSINLLKALAKIDRKNKYRVYLRSVRSSSKQVQQYKWPKNFEFRLVGSNRLWTQVGLALETWKNPVDVLFIPAHTLPIFKNPKVKSVVTMHDLGVEYLPNYHKFPQRYYLDLASKFAARYADRLIAVSEATKSDLIKRYKVSAKKVSVVHEGVDSNFFKPMSAAEVARVKNKYNINGKYVLFVGTVQPRKNLEFLIRVFARILKRKGCRDVNLVIVGKFGWDYEKILKLPKKIKIEKSVKFLKYVPKKDLPALYSGSAVFAFPSLFEGFGLPILEAISCGTQVLASDIPAHREIFKEIRSNIGQNKSKRKEYIVNEAGVLAKVNDEVKWGQFLYQYITQYINIEPSITARHELALRFSWDEAARHTLSVLLKCYKKG